MKIRLCKKYPKIKKLEKKLSKAIPDASVKVTSCINMCKRCKSQPMAKVDGVKVKSKKVKRLIEKIEAL